MAVGVLWLFLAVPWVGLQFVIVIYPALLQCIYKKFFFLECHILAEEIPYFTYMLIALFLNSLY